MILALSVIVGLFILRFISTELKASESKVIRQPDLRKKPRW